MTRGKKRCRDARTGGGRLVSGTLIIALRVVIAAGALMGAAKSHAQISLDGSLTGTPRDLAGPNFRIEAGDGKVFGSNRFHSFSQFNLNSLQSASFTNSPGIKNILSRVTGGSVSNIDGALISETAGANFFFMNPNGVIFGPNASIDVGGAFTVTTADKLKLKDGAVFLATPGAADMSLTSADVASFGFLGPGAPVIVDGSQLSTQAGNSFNVIAGDVTVKNGAAISAPGGNVSMISVASPGTVRLDVTGPGAEATIPGGMAPGDVTVTDSKIDASDNGVGGGGGRLFLRGGKLTIERSEVLSRGTTANSAGGDIEIAGDEVTVGDGSVVDASSDAGAGGNVVVLGSQIDVTGGATITADGETKGGSVQIGGSADSGQVRASRVNVAMGSLIRANGGSDSGGSVTIQGGPGSDVGVAGTVTATSRDGTGGVIEVLGGDIKVGNGARLDASGAAGGGEVYVGGGFQGNDPDKPNATDTTVEEGAVLKADGLHSGDGGMVVAFAENRLDFYGSLSARGSASGNGGFAEISGKKEVYLPDLGGQIDLSSLGGNAGSLLIDPVDVTVTHGAGGGIVGTTITDGAIAAALNGADVTISTSGVGSDDGNIEMNGSGDLGGAAQIFWSTANTLAFSAHNHILMNAGSLIQSSGGGPISMIADSDLNNSGDIRMTNAWINGSDTANSTVGSSPITIRGKNLDMVESTIESNTFGIKAGRDIDIVVADNVRMVGTLDQAPRGSQSGSHLSAIVFERASPTAVVREPGGNISITASSVEVGGNGDNTRIEARTQADGADDAADAGVISIRANSFSVLGGGHVDANTSGFGNPGKIEITAGEMTVDGIGPNGELPNAAYPNFDFTNITSAVGVTTAIPTALDPVRAVGQTIIIDIGTDPTLPTSNFGTLSIRNQGLIDTTTFNVGNGGDISVNAHRVLVENGFISSSSRPIRSVEGFGNSGSVLISANEVQVGNAGSITATTDGRGRGGSIRIEDAAAIVINGVVSANSGGSGAPGDIQLIADSFTGGAVDEFGNSIDGIAIAGNVTTTTVDGGDGDGSILIRAQNAASTVRILDGGMVTATTSGKGDAGSIEIRDAAAIVVDGELSTNSTGTGLDAGAPGAITLIADSVTGGAVDEIGNSIDGIAIAGNVTTTTVDGGEGDGSILIRAQNAASTVRILDGGMVQATTSGKGDAGSIEITASLIELAGGIGTEATGEDSDSENPELWGAAGPITLEAEDGGNGKIMIAGNGLLRSLTTDGRVIDIDDDSIMDNSITVPSDHGFRNGSAVRFKASGEDNTLPGVLDGDTTYYLGEVDDTSIALFSDAALGIENQVTFDEGSSTGMISMFSIAEVNIFADSFESKKDGVSIDAHAHGRGHGGTINFSGGSFTFGGVDGVNEILVDAHAAGDGGDLNFNLSGSLRMDAGARLLSTMREVDEGSVASGAPGAIRINADSVTVLANAQITADTIRVAHAGSIDVNANRITVSGPGAEISTRSKRDDAGTAATGAAGAISLSGPAGGMGDAAASITVENQGVVTTSTIEGGSIATGGIGLITMAARILKLINGGSVTTATTGAGSGGDIRLNITERLAVTNGSSIEADTTGSGIGGSVDVKAGRLRIVGTGQQSSTRISAQSTGELAGNAGDVTINVDGKITLLDGAALKVSTSDNGNADGGNLTVKADQLALKGGSAISASAGQNGGNVFVTTRGGRVTLNNRSTITADAGKDGGNVNVETRGGKLSLNRQSMITANAFRDGGNVKLALDGGTLTVRDRSKITANAETGIGGRVKITGTNGFNLSGGGMVTANSSSGARGGDVTLRLDGGDVVFSGAGSGFMADAGKGDGGNLTITGADSIRLGQGASLSADAGGDGGSLTLATRGGDISLDSGSTLTANAENGDGGDLNLDLNGGALSLDHGSEITANSLRGNGGNIQVNDAGEVNLIRRTVITADAGGNGGNIDLSIIDRGDVTISGESRISANAQRGNGGNVDLHLSGGDLRLDDHSSIAANAVIGNGGNVEIDCVHAVQLTRQSTITADAGRDGGDVRLHLKGGPLLLDNASRISANAKNRDGGNVDVRGAGSATLNHRSAITADAGRDGGDVTVDVGGGDLEIFNGSRISANAKDRDGGNVKVKAGATTMDRYAAISANAGRDGGDVSVFFRNDGLLWLTDHSSILANAQRNGGNLSVIGASGSGVILDHSRITANAVDGSGGNIGIAADFLLANESPITASSEKGTDGTVDIGVKFNLGNQTRLPAYEVDESKVERGLEPSKVPEDYSTFISGGRGGIPVDPAGYLPSMQLWDLPVEEL